MSWGCFSVFGWAFLFFGVVLGVFGGVWNSGVILSVDWGGSSVFGCFWSGFRGVLGGFFGLDFGEFG